MIKPYEKDGKKFFEVFVSKRGLDGKQLGRRKLNIRTEREARDIEYEFKRELDSLLDTKNFWTFEKWHCECLKQVRLTFKASTVIQYDQRLKKHLPDCWNKKVLNSITTDDVFDLVYNQFDRKMSDGSRRVLFKTLKRILEMAVEQGKLDRNPATPVRVKREAESQKVLTAEEAQIFLTAAFSTQHRFYPIWFMALKSGMRSGEMFALTWPDIDLGAGIIHITKQWTNKDGIAAPKSGDRRTIPISSDLKAFLLEYRNDNPGFSQTLFDQRSKSSVTRNDYVLPRLKEWEHGMQAQVTRDFCLSLKVTPVKFHDLRATFITNLLSQGVALVKVMSIVGHRKMSTTDIYLRLAGVDVKGATETMGYSLPSSEKSGNVLDFLPREI